MAYRYYHLLSTFHIFPMGQFLLPLALHQGAPGGRYARYIVACNDNLRESSFDLTARTGFRAVKRQFGGIFSNCPEDLWLAI